MSGLQDLFDFSASRVFIADSAVISNTWETLTLPFLCADSYKWAAQQMFCLLSSKIYSSLSFFIDPMIILRLVCVCIYIRRCNIYHTNHIQIPELDSCKILFYVEPKSLIWTICRCDLRAASKCRGRNSYCDQEPPTHSGVGPLFAVSKSASAPAPKQ